MGKIKFTKHQQQAVDVIGGNILVSAAAGSGKTAVLTQRVINLLTGKNPISADKLVIVTYTVAAANEMRRRIHDKLSEIIENDPSNKLLQSQQLLLSNAKISSIHSLCSSLIRDNFHLLGLSSNIKIADETELTLLKNEAVNEILEKHYEIGNSSFLKLVEFTCTKDDQKLVTLILSIYNFIRSFAFPLSFLNNVKLMYSSASSIDDNIWLDSVSKHILDGLNYCINLLKSCINDMSSDNIVFEKYNEAFSYDLSQLINIRDILINSSYSEACAQIMQIEKMRLSPIRKNENPEFTDYLKGKRDYVYSIVNDFKKKFMSFTNDDFLSDIQILIPHINILFSLISDAYELIELKKHELEIIDYSDLEHYTIKLLVNETESGYEKTDIAYELSNSIEQIMIDECQDINEVQDLIFRLLSRDEKNLFMVGDVKQSIYRFRQAMPKLFMDKKKTFPTYDEIRHTDNSTGTITLESNFRSRKDVCDVVNYIFSQIMSEDMGEIDYNDEESLVAGASYDEKDDTFPEVHIVDYSNENDDEKSIVEARYVAKLIKRMIAQGYEVSDNDEKRVCTYKDFAILLRKKKDISTVYLNELIASGIPCFCDSTEGYFGEYEVTLIINLLKIIDNPLLDVPLLSVLMSPIFGFSPDQLTEIRLINKNIPLYVALTKLAKSGDIACNEFVKMLSIFRQKAALLPTDEIIQIIYDQTDFIAISGILGDVEKKNANLRLMLTYAKQYERVGSNGLSGFIRYIDKVIANNQDFSCANTASSNDNTVKILSIHSSKGLEFPICIVADCAKGFNKRDINTYPYQMHSGLGFSMRITDSDTLRSYNNLPFEAIKLQREKETISEEMRVLYVALTRAKEKLIMVMTFENAHKKLKNIVDSCSSSDLTPYEIYSMNSFAGWIIAALIRHPNFYEIRNVIGCAEVPVKAADFIVKGYIVTMYEKDIEAAMEKKDIIEPSIETVAYLNNVFNFKYDKAPLTTIPAKLTVTQIAKQENADKIKLTARPNFMLEQNTTPAQKGTILHNFMQFADFSNAKHSLDNEIARLIKEQYLSREHAKSLDRKKIQAFLSSSLFERMSKNEIRREFKFNFFIKAGEIEEGLTADHSESEIFVQGIADCLILEEDGITIVDYKTDYAPTEDILIERYYNQLRLYKSAIENTFEQNVKQCLIYSLHLGKEIEIKVK